MNNQKIKPQEVNPQRITTETQQFVVTLASVGKFFPADKSTGLDAREAVVVLEDGNQVSIRIIDAFDFDHKPGTVFSMWLTDVSEVCPEPTILCTKFTPISVDINFNSNR